VQIYIKVKGELHGKGKTMKACLKHITKLFAQGHTDIIVSGGKLGRWMNTK
jgi:hypothetical protein